MKDAGFAGSNSEDVVFLSRKLLQGSRFMARCARNIAVFLGFLIPMIFFICPILKSQSPDTGIKQFTMDNGMQVILKENHASPMITSLIFVKAGSKYESKYNNGVTHFLEHLLFNGTATQTQEGLSKGIEKLGGYINAFTDKGFTAYLVTMPREYIDFGMATQADMLFNSNFPEDKFPKERRIVVEEMKKDNDAEGAPAESFFDEKGMIRTAYSQPVIGYESTIGNIPREAVIDYWKRFYGPNNMTMLIIGDFDTTKMAEAVVSVFGKFPKADLPVAPPTPYQKLVGKQIFMTVAKTKATYIDYSIEAPHYSDSDYFAMALMEDFLSDPENSPLTKALKTGDNSLASSVSVTLDTKEEFSRFNIEIITENRGKADSIIVITDKILENIASQTPSEELLNGYKVSRRCKEIYMSEKLHHYAYTYAPLIAVTGWDFFEKIQDRIDSVRPADLENACKNYFSNLRYIVTVVSAPSRPDESVYSPTGPTANEVLAHYRATQFPTYDLTAGKNFKMPAIKEAATAETRTSRYLKQIFDNGLTVVVKSNPESRVFAMNVIGLNRSATEPEGKDGITDFVNHLIEKGTITRNAVQLSGELASIGANVTLYDNPWIPYDDRYTTHQFAFMKFETIDQFTEKGIELFSDMIAYPAFDSTEVEKVRGELMGLLGRNSGSTYKIARELYYGALFAGTPYAKTIEGTARTIGSITAADLKEHHGKIYAPENMIVTVGTNDSPERIMELLRKTLGQIRRTGFVPVEPIRPANVVGIRTAQQKMEKAQVYIYMGNLLPSAESPDAAALTVASTILSNRLQKNLREVQGLAYSVGSSVELDKHFGWYVCSIGTSAANFEKARNGIISEIEKLKAAMPSDIEVAEAINSIWGSRLTATLSRINQVFYMGVDEYLGLGYNYSDVFMDEIRQVDKGAVMKVARRYFDLKNYVIATAGNM
jgi:zinc protease